MNSTWHHDGSLQLAGGLLALGAAPYLETADGAAAMESLKSTKPGTLAFRAPAGILTRTLEDAPDGWLRLRTRLALTQPARIVRLAESFQVNLSEPDLVWTPNLVPEPGDVQGDHCFRAPALLLHQGRLAVALVPDLAVLGPQRHSEWPAPGSEIPPAPQIKGYADLRIDAARAGYRMENGLANYDIRAHVYYQLNGKPLDLIPGQTLETACYLRATRDHTDPQDIRYVLGFLWQTFAKPGTASALPQKRPFDAYTAKSFTAIEEEGYLSPVTLPSGTRGYALSKGAVRARIVKPNDYFQCPTNCMWFSAWFNGLRVAIGLRLFAQRTGGERAPHWIQVADGIRDILQQAPDPTGRGLIPQLFDTDSGNWWNSVPRLMPGNDPHTFDLTASAHTGLLMLTWHRLVEPDEPFVARCRRLGTYLLERQSPAGGFPAFARGDGQPMPELSDNGHSGMAALFLAELFNVTREPRWREAALRACRFFADTAIPENRFQDFETYYSCSNKPLDFFDSCSGQKPQNNLPIYWMAETLLRAAEWTGESHWLDWARRCLDRLSLYQQVWSPTFLQAYAFGGFGVMNTDGEWNDMRQPKFAQAYFRSYLLSGLREDFERGAAALRAGYTLYCDPRHTDTNPLLCAHFREGLMPENYGHCGPRETHAVMSGFDWGSGMQATMCELALRRYGGIFVHLGNGHAFGLDGCVVRKADFTPDRVRLRVAEQTGVSRTIDVILLRDARRARTTVALTGGAEQEIGIDLAPLDFKAEKVLE